MQGLHRSARRWADDADFRPQRTQVHGRVVQTFQEEADAVGAGEDQPIVGGKVRQRAVERAIVCGGTNLNGGHLNGLGSQGAKARGKGVGLAFGAGHHDAFAEQREALKPI